MKLNPTFTKLAILAAVTLLLCIVLNRIGGLAQERQWRQREATQGVEQSLAGAQALIGPLLVRNCTETWAVPGTAGKADVVQSRDFPLIAQPSRLEVSGGISPEVRQRGLFKVNTYTSQLKLDARWDAMATLIPKADHPSGRVSCGDAAVVISLSDTRGIRAASVLRDGQALTVRPSTTLSALPDGLHAMLPELRSDQPLTLTAQLSLVGSQSLGIVPAAGQTQVQLQSSWPHPSFTGQFLPTEHQVGVSGFTARWQVSSLSSSTAADLQAGKPLGVAARPTPNATAGTDLPAPPAKAGLDVLAVELIDPVNPYVMSDRAIKYGLMFIALTFLTVGLTELLTGRRVHPVQYLFVGMALSLFFLLLLSLSEHLPFLVAYVIAAAAAAGVLTPYAAAMLGSWWRGAAFGGGIALLYGALYVLLSREQTALVIGAVLLFTVLAVVMTLTRRLDWYRLGGSVPAQG